MTGRDILQDAESCQGVICGKSSAERTLIIFPQLKDYGFLQIRL